MFFEFPSDLFNKENYHAGRTEGGALPPGPRLKSFERMRGLFHVESDLYCRLRTRDSVGCVAGLLSTLSIGVPELVRPNMVTYLLRARISLQSASFSSLEEELLLMLSCSRRSVLDVKASMEIPTPRSNSRIRVSIGFGRLLCESCWPVTS